MAPCYNPDMDKITLKNFRCFREEQTARLAPLTLLVGENSTGKTSFMALIQALWDVAFAKRVPDFREPPYNLGSFQDIVSKRGGRGNHAETFEATIEHGSAGIGLLASKAHMGPITVKAKFSERNANPFPTTLCIESGGKWEEVQNLGNGKYFVKWGDNEEECLATEVSDLFESSSSLLSYHHYVGIARNSRDSLMGEVFPLEARPYSSAPIRSRPLRTYDPSRPWPDPEGEYIPTFLASVYHRDRESWHILKRKLEDFGQASGLFDEISIKSFGKTEGTPFQIQIRKFANKGRHKGPQRNLIDVGYGVSQALPLLTELLKAEESQIFLLQQPEIHLHPRAQAELGSLFCELAAQGRQLIVETHSDYLMDRVRMDIRDKKSSLTHDDVSILYFEHGDLDVKIHSLRLDKMGNVLDAPPSYGQFFMEETRRSIGVGL